jgi:hypothetical protein
MQLAAIPNLWTSPHGFLHRDRLRREAGRQARRHPLPISLEEVDHRLRETRKTLAEKLRLNRGSVPLDLEFHGEIELAGYKIHRISFASAPDIRVTGNLYVPDGPGPFPAVLNMHGHWEQGKIAAHVQSRGHLLALSGFVTLTVDAAGSGERAEEERKWSYHGAAKAGEILLAGDSLLGLQVRDNQAALDVLQSLSFVLADRIGATGASGGGNQTMWLAAMDDRVKVAVPVVSVGSFEVYVGHCNCLCETLPGGLAIAEEWMVLGLIAPRPLLIINALHDQPAFGYEAMTSTCRQVQEVYALHTASAGFDFRLLDMEHGYFAGPLRAMLAWMKRWLQGQDASDSDLPDWSPVPEELLLCYPPGTRPDACSYRANRETFQLASPREADGDPDTALAELVRLVGWSTPRAASWVRRKVLPDGSQSGAMETTRGLILPAAVSRDWESACDEVRLILSPHGKRGAFTAEEWAKAVEAGVLAVTVDLPASGELAWDSREVASVRFHDSSRACLWLGYTLVGEWAEAIASVGLRMRLQCPGLVLQVVAEKEAVLAALLCRALHPDLSFTLTESECPKTLGENKDSLVWTVPGLSAWGDLARLRALTSAIH